MPENHDKTPSEDAERFAAQAHEPSPGLLREYWDFLRYNKKWWLTPILLVMLLLGLLIALSASGLAPFIYPV